MKILRAELAHVVGKNRNPTIMPRGSLGANMQQKQQMCKIKLKVAKLERRLGIVIGSMIREK